MAIVYADRVKVRSLSSGTGEFELENAVEGFQSFDAIGDGNQTYYGIVDSAGNWEIGLGTYEIDSTNRKLYRNSVVSSSNNNLLVNFPVGGKNVYTTIPSSLVAPLTGSELDPVFTGSSLITADIKGSIFADDSTLLIDGTNAKIVGPIESSSITGNITFGNVSDNISVIGNIAFNGVVNFDSAIIDWVPIVSNVLVNNGLPILPTQTLDINGSIFADDSTMLVNSVEGKIVGPIETSSLTTKKVEEDFQSLTGATGTVAHDCSQSHIFYHSSISADFTANFTNLDLESGRGTTVTLVLSQGVTPYIANAVEIAGSAQSILWQGSATAPSGNASKTDIISFSILNDAGTYSIYGQLTSFG